MSDADMRALPPWGVMDEIVETILDRHVPEAWIAPDRATAAAQYETWFEALVGDLNVLLWPTYDRGTRSWTKLPNEALILADFELMHTLHDLLAEPINRIAQSDDAELPTHEDMFNEEDDNHIGIGARYERYDPGLPAHLTADMNRILFNGCNRKVASVHYQLKARLQRPRPNQVAYLLPLKEEFHFLWGRTSGTPAMVSGHCLQGTLAGCSAYQLFGETVDPVSVQALQQLTVDIGDRRVFAGVHYPSDNLSSWYTALKLLPHVVEASRLRSVVTFLSAALERHSAVFKAITTQIDRNGRTSPFEPCVEAIRREVRELLG